MPKQQTAVPAYLERGISLDRQVLLFNRRKLASEMEPEQRAKEAAALLSPEVNLTLANIRLLELCGTTLTAIRTTKGLSDVKVIEEARAGNKVGQSVSRQVEVVAAGSLIAEVSPFPKQTPFNLSLIEIAIRNTDLKPLRPRP